MQHKKTAFVIGFIAIAYTSFWYHMAGNLQDRIAVEISKLEEQGYTVKYDSLSIAGFPFKFAVDLQNPSIEKPDIVTSKIEGLARFSASLLAPNVVTCSAEGEHTLTLLNDTLVIKGIGFEGDLPLFISWGDVDLFYKNVAITASEKLALIADDFRVTHADLEGDAEYQMTLDAAKVELPNILEQPFTDIGLEFKFSGKHSGDTYQERLKTWAQSNGEIDITRMTIKYGDITFFSEGTFALDENLQPLAAFSLTVDGMDAFLNSLVEQKIINKQAVSFIKLGIGALAKLSGQDGDDQKLALTLQNGTLSIGGIPVQDIQNIDWSKLNEIVKE
ncbi:MAG: DUF2125 domain-containing protein [Alphaproteobacteria bacterium]